jgi:hypothetical protein
VNAERRKIADNRLMKEKDSDKMRVVYEEYLARKERFNNLYEANEQVR